MPESDHPLLDRPRPEHEGLHGGKAKNDRFDVNK
jgi:hypothetical protein